MSASIKKLFVVVLIVVALSTILGTTRSTAGAEASQFYTCAATRCYKYNPDGSAHTVTIGRWTWWAYVWNGSRVYATNVGRGWLKQDLFRSQGIYFKASQFVIK